MVPKQYTEDLKEQKLKHYSSGLQALKDLTDLGNADANMAQDYAGRFAFELMQNGADAYQKASTRNSELFPPCEGRVCFAHTKNCLVVANTGTAFSYKPDPEDRADISSLESISRLGESTKKSGEYIGNKGMGFRSVYQVCDRLWLISEGHQIVYDGRSTWDELHKRLQSSTAPHSKACISYLEDYRNRIPMLKVGFWFELEDLPAEVEGIVEDLRSEGYQTVLVLERRSGPSAMKIDDKFVWDRLSSLNEKEILFLDTLGEVQCRNIEEPSKSFTFYMERERDKRTVRREPGNRNWAFLVYQFPIPGIRQKAQIAFLLDDAGRPKPAPLSDSVFYSFYPAAREMHGFPFFIHSYFMLNPNREYFNYENRESIERNRVLLDDLSSHLEEDIIPDLQQRFPDFFLPSILLPHLSEAVTEQLSGLRKLKKPDRALLSGQDALAAWFISETVARIAKAKTVRNLSGKYVAVNDIQRAGDGLTARAADTLFRQLADLDCSRRLPKGLIYLNERLRVAIADVEDFLKENPLTLEKVAVALEQAGPELTLNAQESAAMILLLSSLSDGESQSLLDTIERIRAARTRVLPCLGDNNFQPLPEYPEQGKLLRASADSPLVFYLPSSTEVDADDLEEAETETEQPAEQLNVPLFCHVHVLEADVLSAFPEVEPDRIRTILREQFGLRPFKPEDVFLRIAESTLGTVSESLSLTAEQHRAFLEATIRLVERRRLRRVARDPSHVFKPWYLRDRRDSDWRLHYFLASSYLPIGETWVRGNEVVLAGRLSAYGEEIKPAYRGTNQLFLDEDNEAEWLVRLLNDYYGNYSKRGESIETDIDEEKLRFRRHIYMLLGAWDGLRLEIVQHPEGIRSQASDPAVNPHQSVGGDEWRQYIEKSECPWVAYPLEQCRLVQSAAIPHLEDLSRTEESRALTITGLQRSLDAIRQFVKVEVRTRNNSPAYMLSLMYWQLQEFPWVDDSLRDSPKDARIWYTRQNISPVTHSRQSAHYLRSVTGRQLSESLAHALKMPILEEADRNQLEAFVELYSSLCHRLERRPYPGQGFLTLYRTVVSKIQQIIVGGARFDEEKLNNAKNDARETLAEIKEAGVIVLGQNRTGLKLRKDLENLYYDDTGMQNPVFRRFLSMAAFDDTSQGFARLLGINLLSSAEIEYDDGSDTTFGGNEEAENEAEQILHELRAPIFAFRAFSSFIPEGQRLVVGEETYNQRWETFRNLRVEIVPRLRIKVGALRFREVSYEFPVVLEHESQDRVDRRLFIRQTILTSDNRIPLRLLARPLAAALGAEGQTIAVEMLLQQYEKGALDSVHAYLLEQCEVTAEQIREIEDLDQELAGIRNKRIAELATRLFGAIRARCPSHIPDKRAREDLQGLISDALSIQAPAVLDYLQDNLGIPLHLLASELELRPVHENIDKFTIRKDSLRERSLLAAAVTRGIDKPSESWDQIMESYEALHLPVEVEYKRGVSEEELLVPITGWLRNYDSKIPTDPNRELSIGEQELLARLSTGPPDPRRNVAVLNVFIPWVLALCQKASAIPLSDLIEVIDESGLQEIAEQSGSLEEIRNRLEEFLNRFHVSHEAIDGLFGGWPLQQNSAETGIGEEEVERLRVEIERYQRGQHSRATKKVSTYNRYLKELITNQGLPADPIIVSFASNGNDRVEPPPNGGAPPRKIKKRVVSGDEFLAINLRNRVTGECAENYALEVQRIRWRELTGSSPALARERLNELRNYYDLSDSSGGRAEPEPKWLHLETLDPKEWTNDENWQTLRQLLYMAEWSTSAGYDVLGLDGDGGVRNWHIYRIEVKATSGKRKLDFPISRNELEEARRSPDTYVIWRVLDIAHGRVPRFFRLENPTRLIEEGLIETADQVTVLKPLLDKFD